VFWKVSTVAVILGSPIWIGLVYDVCAGVFGGNEATISRECLNVSLRYWQFALSMSMLFGTLHGHLFWPVRGVGVEREEIVAAVCIIGPPFLVVAYGLIRNLVQPGVGTSHVHAGMIGVLGSPPALMVAGFVMGMELGHRFLPQHI
jgi:hypothetical protein